MTCLAHFRQLSTTTVATNTVPLLPSSLQLENVPPPPNFQAFLDELKKTGTSFYDPKRRVIVSSQTVPMLKQDPTRLKTWLFSDDDLVSYLNDRNSTFAQEIAYTVPGILPVLRELLKDYAKLPVVKRGFLLAVAFYALPSEELSQFLQKRMLREKITNSAPNFG